MSPLDAIRAVMAAQAPLSATQRHVLMCWASHVNADGVAWPGPKALAKQTALAPRSVRRALGDLRRMGVLVEVGRTELGGFRERLDLEALSTPGQSVLPRTQCPTPDTVSPRTQCPTPPDRESYPPGHSVLPPLTESPTPPDTVSTKEDIEEVIEEDTEEDKKRTGPPGDWDRLADAWSAIPSKRRPPRGSPSGRQLAALLKHAGSLDRALQVLDWWQNCDAPDSRAAFLRGKGLGLKTLSRPANAEEYADLAAAWVADGRPTGSPGTGHHGAGYLADDEDIHLTDEQWALWEAGASGGAS